MGIEPLYPQLCISSPATHVPWDDKMITPMQLNAMLHSLPCSLTIQREDNIMILQLLAQVCKMAGFIIHFFRANS